MSARANSVLFCTTLMAPGVSVASRPRPPIGVVTSGSHSPILGRPVAMAYLPNNVKDLGPLETFVRNKGYAAELSKMPFVPTKYKSA